MNSTRDSKIEAAGCMAGAPPGQIPHLSIGASARCKLLVAQFTLLGGRVRLHPRTSAGTPRTEAVWGADSRACLRPPRLPAPPPPLRNHFVAGPASCRRSRWSRRAFLGSLRPIAGRVPAPPGSSVPGHYRGARSFWYAVGPLRVYPRGLPCGGAGSQAGRPAWPCGASPARPQGPVARSVSQQGELHMQLRGSRYVHGYWPRPGPITHLTKTPLKYNIM